MINAVAVALWLVAYRKLRRKYSVISDGVKSVCNALPIGNAVKGNKVRVVVPGYLLARYRKIVVYVSCNELTVLTVFGDHIAAVIIAHLVSCVYAKACGGMIPKSFLEEVKIFLSLGVLESNGNTDAFCVIKKLFKALNAYLASVILVAKALPNVAYHNFNSDVRAIVKAVDKLRENSLAALALVPDKLNSAEGRVNGLENKTVFLDDSRFFFKIRAGLPAGEDGIKSRFCDSLYLFLGRCVETDTESDTYIFTLNAHNKTPFFS